MLGITARSDRVRDRGRLLRREGGDGRSAATCAVAVFRTVGDFSEREVSKFGAPSLITRSTNDVQQVQMLVLMTCTMLVSAPILAIGGVIMAMREDLELSWIMVVAVPVLLLVGRAHHQPHGAAVPVDAEAHRRREPRAARAAHRHPRHPRLRARAASRAERFDEANDELTDTALQAGRLFALMFPIVMLVLNVSSVAVLWFGAFRVEDGSMQVGSLIAFLSYLIQILMAVMMATLIAFLMPRAVGLAPTASARCSRPTSSVVEPRAARHRAAPRPGTRRVPRTSTSPTPAPSSRCCTT